jgi:hypothetical protein
MKTLRQWVSFMTTFMVMLLGAASMVPAFAETESRGDRDASGFKTEIAQASGESQGGYKWSDLEGAFDRASASWMNVYGDHAFIAVRPWVEQGIRAMNGMQWIPQKTQVVISMLDARGDFAQVSDGGSCRAQINIDESGHSPIIKALGSKGSAPAFLIAHELAHCRFDSLEADQKIPTPQMFAKLGVPKVIAKRMGQMMMKPEEGDGSLSLVDSYDEALADSAATAALLQFEHNTGKAGFATAIDRAQSLRMGLLFMSKRRNTRAEAHQGGFAIEDIVAQFRPGASKEDAWDMARQAALKSVLYSSLALKESPKWWAGAASGNVKVATQWRKLTSKHANAMMNKRNFEADEDLYIATRSPALMAITIPDGSNAQSWDDPNAHWREVGWIDPGSITN